MSVMTPRQRWLATFEGKPVDRLPTDYWATGEFHGKLKSHLGVEEDEQLWRMLGIDRPGFVGLEYKPARPPAAGVSMWGVRHTAVDYGTGSYHEAVDPPLAAATSVEEVLAHPWPDVEAFDYDAVPGQIARHENYRWIMGGSYEPFLLYCELRGLEKAYEDLLLDPEIAEAGLRKIFDFHFEHNRRIWHAGAGRVDCMYLAEDLGGQSSPLFSLDVYRRFLLPNQKRMADLARSFGVRVFYHTDGAARPFLPDLVHTAGINLLNPLQWKCPGMDLPSLAAEWGRQLIFHGGIDNQHTLPFGTEDEVRTEVRVVAAHMRHQRWICAPCHNIQNVSPVGNVLAMYEEAKRILP
jgi:uroporphyrinogen decarboxylase